MRLDRLREPVFMRRLNGWLAVGWLAASVPICLFFADSLPFLVFVSVYAVVASHWSSWQAARVEEHQAEDADVQEVLDAVREDRR